jgi:hypothetical protein
MKYIVEQSNYKNTYNVQQILHTVLKKALSYTDHNIWVNMKPGMGGVSVTKLILHDGNITYLYNRPNHYNITFSDLNTIFFKSGYDIYIISDFNTLSLIDIERILKSIENSDKRFIIFTSSADDNVKKLITSQTNFKCIDLDNHKRDVMYIKKINGFID